MQINADKDKVVGNAVNDTTLATFPMREARELAIRIIKRICANMEHHPHNVDAQIAIVIKVACNDTNDAGQQAHGRGRHFQPCKKLGQPKPYWPVETKIQDSLDFARFEGRFDLGDCRVSDLCRH